MAAGQQNTTESVRVSGRELLPSSSPWHTQAGCPCSPCGRKHYSLERKATERSLNTESVLVVKVGVLRVCGKVGARNSDWFSELARKLHQPSNESQTEAEHVMQSGGNSARGRRGLRSDTLLETHRHWSAWEIFQLCKHFQIAIEGQGSFEMG